MNRNPGDIILRTRQGVVVRYSPSQGSSVRYRVICPHGRAVNERTQADARETARDPADFCDDCAEGRPVDDDFGGRLAKFVQNPKWIREMQS